ncbi:hsp90 co-chaperone Cdc37 [Bachmanniomyces sp. S44760]|nr:hsp90 co-chaperone Cdc37 [Bachmanniomyces sp. S44760]
MVLDYSKWDALELSDDSDIEVHPNVDKRSFIRAKQNQIHQKRFERKHQIETLKYERVINDGLLRRIDTLLSELRSHEANAKDPDAFIYQALISSAGDPDDDEPPKPPEGVYTKNEQPRYSVMMGSLADQVKKEAEESSSENIIKAFVKGVDGHKKKVASLQKELNEKLGDLEREESKKITSESIHTGFNMSSVSKVARTSVGTTTGKTEALEMLNPSLKKDHLLREENAQSSGADADVEEAANGNAGEDEHIEASILGKQFAKIKMGDYKADLEFISKHGDVVKERETDGLLIEGFNAQMDGKAGYAKQCVHQALLLQYCRSLGPDGVRLFFKRITTPGHQAQKVFFDDVNSTYNRIESRTVEIAKERAANPTSGEAGVEQIQLHAVDPNTQIHINIPQPNSGQKVEQDSRAVYERFPPGLQRALESGSLERVNEVLGKMSVEEAEEVVEQLGEGGMLSLEEGVIDGTTEEGQEKLKQLEGQAGKAQGHADEG